MANLAFQRPIDGPLPRRDILAICAFLNRVPAVSRTDETATPAESLLDRLAAAARMQ